MISRRFAPKSKFKIQNILTFECVIFEFERSRSVSPWEKRVVRVDFNKRYNLAKEALEEVKNLINPVQVTINQSNLQNLFKFVSQRQKPMNLPQ